MEEGRVRRVKEGLDGLYKHLESVKSETIRGMGETETVHVADFHGNNWIDLWRWVAAEYGEEARNSLLFFYYSMLFKEICWTQLLFLLGNYSTVYRNLRYVWELICQGHYIDSQCLGETLDQRMKLAHELEKKKYGWKLVRLVSEKLGFDERKIETHVQPMWHYLNKHAHPSPVQFDEVAREDFSIFITDSFNGKLATSLLRNIDGVLDIVYLALLKSFPKAAIRARGYELLDEWKELIPMSYSIVAEKRKT